MFDESISIEQISTEVMKGPGSTTERMVMGLLPSLVARPMRASGIKIKNMDMASGSAENLWWTCFRKGLQKITVKLFWSLKNSKKGNIT